MDINIKTIPDEQQRYDTVGDYQSKQNGLLEIYVSKMSDERYEFLIALHELVESYLCKTRGITDKEIDEFDMQYEENRKPGDTFSEPGDAPNAPYNKEHEFATKLERLMADELEVDWQKYGEECASFTKRN